MASEAEEKKDVAGAGQILVPPERKQKIGKKKSSRLVVKKEKKTFYERLLRLSLKVSSIPGRALANRVPEVREYIMRSNMNISAEALISLSIFFSICMIPVMVFLDAFVITIKFDLALPFIPVILVLPIVIGLSLPRISAGSRGQALDNEIAHLVGYITVLAGGGISLITTLKRISKADMIFPAAAKEARRILLDIEVFGMDPISALEKAVKYTPNRTFTDFIGGYVAVLKTGGSTTSYLEAKLKDIFAYREIKVRTSSELIGTFAESYIIATVVMGVAFFILFATQNLMSPGQTSVNGTQIIMFSGLFVPVISLVFIVLIGSIQTKEPFTYELPFYVFLGCTPIAAFFFFVPLGLPIYMQLGIGLALTSSPAMILQMIYVRNKKSVEGKLANFLRDISEIRKTGIAPEKAIEQLSERNYGGLTKQVQKISSQLSWGTPMRRVIENFSKSVKSWVTQAVAFLLLEVVDVGGGTSKMFIALADFTEKNNQLESQKRSMVRPYVIIPYIGAILIVVTTAMMVYFISAPGLSPSGSTSFTLASPALIQQSTNILLTASFFQAWIMGLVAGKMGEGSVADGFKHATMLVIISMIAVLITRLFIKI